MCLIFTITYGLLIITQHDIGSGMFQENLGRVECRMPPSPLDYTRIVFRYRESKEPSWKEEQDGIFIYLFILFPYIPFRYIPWKWKTSHSIYIIRQLAHGITSIAKVEKYL